METALAAPKFFRIAVGLLATLLLCAVAATVLLLLYAKEINRAGGWGFLLIVGLFLVVATLVCFACAICAAVSLKRGEPHGRASVVILIGSVLVVIAFGPKLIRGVFYMLAQAF